MSRECSCLPSWLGLDDDDKDFLLFLSSFCLRMLFSASNLVDDALF
jgi:hypothetical protein